MKLMLVRSAVLLCCALNAMPVRAIESSAELVTKAVALLPDAGRGRQLYEQHCTHCHSAQGSGTGARQFPQIGGQREDYLLMQLAGFVALGRLSPQMHDVLQQPPLADPQSLRDLSFYLANEPHEPHGEHGDARALGRGRNLYTQLCSRCHGGFGEGSAQGPVPAVGGQNYTYLREQVTAFVGGHRSMVDPALMDTVRRLSNEDVRAVADYMSRMPASVDVHYGVIGEIPVPAPAAAAAAAADVALITNRAGKASR